MGRANNRYQYGLYDVITQTGGGFLDFKQYLSATTLYRVNDTLYNRNEAGNFEWSYFMASKDYSWGFSNFGVQTVSFLGNLFRFNPGFDETWDRTARRAGYDFYIYRQSLGDISMNDY